MLKYLAGATLLLAGCEPAEARCERLRVGILIADLASEHYDEDYRQALYWVSAHGRATDSGRVWQARADSIVRAYGARNQVKMTDRSWFRQHCQ